MRQQILRFWLEWPVPKEEQAEEISVRSVDVQRSSRVYRSGAEVIAIWLRLGP